MRSTGGAISITGRYNATDEGANAAGEDHAAKAEAESVSVALLAAGSGATATATDGGTVDVNVAGGTLSASGEIKLLAVSYAAPFANVLGVGAAVGIGVGLSKATATANGATRAHMGGSVTAASALVVKTIATQAPDSDATAGAGGLLGSGSGSESTAKVETGTAGYSAEASLGSGTVALAGTVTVHAKLTAKADALAEGVAAAALVAVGRSDATATVTPTINAFVAGGSVTSSAGSIGVTAEYAGGAAGSNGAVATAHASGGALAGIQGAHSTATASPAVETYAAGTLTAGSNITLRALSASRASADSAGTAGGLVGIGESEATATAGGSTKAHLDGTVASAANLTVEAIANDAARATSSAVAGGFVGDATGNTSDATANPSLRAYLGDNAAVTTAANVSISASETPEADAHTKGGAGGFVGISDATSTSTTSPDVRAYVGSGVTVTAGGDISIEATIKPATGGGPTYAIESVDTAADTLTVSNHGLATGDTVVYQGNPAIGNLTVGREYNVVSVYTGAVPDPSKISFGAAFDGQACTSSTQSCIDSTRDLIRFGGLHHLESGDAVHYAPLPGTTAIGGLDLGGTYYVLVVNDRTVRLVATQDQATDPESLYKRFLPGAVSGNVITLTNHGFADGQAVTYHAPTSRIFYSNTVDVETTFVDGAAPGNDPDANNIVFIDDNGNATPHGFSDGEIVVYDSRTPAGLAGTAIGGLVNATQYRVTFVDANTLQLGFATPFTRTVNFSGSAITLGSGTWAALGFAVGQTLSIANASNGMLNATRTITNLAGGVLTYAGAALGNATGVTANFTVPALPLAPDKDKFSPASQDIHSLTRAGDLPIGLSAGGRLEDGVTYYVDRIDADSFQLQDGSGTVLGLTTLNLGPVAGHAFSPVVELDSASGSGNHALRIDLTSNPGGVQYIEGPGGIPLSVIVPPSGDGTSSVRSEGGAGGFVGVGSNEATLNLRPVAKAYTEGDLLIAGRGVSISSTISTSGSASAANASGGFVGVGDADTSIFAYTDNESYVAGGSSVIAGDDFQLLANTYHSVLGSTRATAGGVVGVADAEDNRVDVDYSNKVTIGAGATVVAEDRALIEATTGGSIRSKAYASGAGFGADGEGRALLFLGQNGGALTQAEIGAGATLVANSVAISALTSGLSASAYSKSYGAGFYGESTDTATLTADLDNAAYIRAGAVVTGLAGVDIITSFRNVSTDADSFSEATGLFGHVDANATNDTDLESDVFGEAGAVVTAGPRNAENDSLEQPGGYERLAFLVNGAASDIEMRVFAKVSRRALAAGDSEESGTRTTASSVDFDSDVVILAGEIPVLEIDSNDKIVRAIAVTVRNAGSDIGAGETVTDSEIFVNDITNIGPGQVRFIALDSIDGSGGTWRFEDAVPQVTIINRSGKNLRLHDIDVLTDDDPTVDLFSETVPLTFFIERSVGAPFVHVLNTTAGDVVLEGSIQNPTGTTLITNLGGDVYGGQARGTTDGAYANGRSAACGGSEGATSDGRYSLVCTNVLRIEAPEGNVGVNGDGTGHRVNIAWTYTEIFPPAASFVTSNVSAGGVIGLGRHPLYTGQRVVYHAGGTALDGLVDGGIYWVIAQPDGQSIKLAADPSLDPIVIDGGSSAATDGHSLSPLDRFSVEAATAVFLDIRALIRTIGTDPVIVRLDEVVAGETIDLLLRPTVVQTLAAASFGGIGIKAPSSDSTRVTYVAHFRDGGAGTPQPPDAYATGNEEVDSLYDFRARDSDGAFTLPGLVAGKEITIAAAESEADDTRIDILGIVDVTGTDGIVNVLTNGYIGRHDRNPLTPIGGLSDNQPFRDATGDLRVGLIQSTASTVALAAQKAIVDAAGDTDADVAGTSITLIAGFGLASGGVGATTNFLEIDLVADAGGDLWAYDIYAAAPGGVYVEETDGDLIVADVATPADATLATRAGSLLAAATVGTGAAVRANSIDLSTTGGSIGVAGALFSIDSAYTAAGDVGLESEQSIWLVEVQGPLKLVVARAGAIALIEVREHAGTGDDLDLLATGKVLFVENAEETIDAGYISADERIELRIGDDMSDDPTTSLTAPAIDIYLDNADTDAGVGTDTTLRGTFTATGVTRIFGNGDADRITLFETTLAGDTRVYGSATPSPAGGQAPEGDDEDLFTVVRLASMAATDTLVLDGQSDADSYVIQTWGSQGADHDYVINVLDTGAPDSGDDTLEVRGVDNNTSGIDPDTQIPYPADDIFLLRAILQIPGETADRPAFVALLHGTLRRRRGRCVGRGRAGQLRHRHQRSPDRQRPRRERLLRHRRQQRRHDARRRGGLRHIPDRPALRLQADRGAREHLRR